ncbi:MAG: hypothetical protein QNJ72_37805 [Pleurocapsa sp. MO_226.B13]|nr:hypothetical protein [Pleurocapsa sp. MO_226.B13]
MKVKLMSLLAGLVTLSIVAAPLAAQACNGGNKDRTTQDPSTSIPTESSVTFEESTVRS